jgi:seryl-tRNA synthetase
MNDIKDIRENPDKYRKGLSDRGQDPTEIDRLLEADTEARMAKTRLQNLQSQSNVISEMFALDKNQKTPVMAREAKKQTLMTKLVFLREEQLTLLQQEIDYLDKKIPEKEAQAAELDQRLANWAATTEHASVIEEVCDEIRENFKGSGI